MKWNESKGLNGITVQYRFFNSKVYKNLIFYGMPIHNTLCKINLLTVILKVVTQ